MSFHLQIYIYLSKHCCRSFSILCSSLFSYNPDSELERPKHSCPKHSCPKHSCSKHIVPKPEFRFGTSQFRICLITRFFTWKWNSELVPSETLCSLVIMSFVCVTYKVSYMWYICMIWESEAYQEDVTELIWNWLSQYHFHFIYFWNVLFQPHSWLSSFWYKKRITVIVYS